MKYVAVQNFGLVERNVLAGEIVDKKEIDSHMFDSLVSGGVIVPHDEVEAQLEANELAAEEVLPEPVPEVDNPDVTFAAAPPEEKPKRGK